MSLSDGGPLSMSGTPEREGAIVLRDGRRLAWSEWGPSDGRVVVVLQGMPGSSHYCPDVDATNALGVRMISIDRPGYGDSDPKPGRTLLEWPEDQAALLDSLAIEAAPIVGWSSGVPFALASAFALPLRVAGLALVAGEGPLDEVPGAWEAMPPDQAEHIRRRRADPVAGRGALVERARYYAEDPDSIIRMALETSADRADQSPDIVLMRDPRQRAAMTEMFRHGAKSGADGYVDDALAITRSWGFSPSQVTCPVTVYYGARDGLADRRDSEYLASSIPGADLIIEPDAGHSLPARHWSAILERLLPA